MIFRKIIAVQEPCEGECTTDEAVDKPRVIEKTGFMDALEEYPLEQLHQSPSAAVDEILLTAALCD